MATKSITSIPLENLKCHAEVKKIFSRSLTAQYSKSLSDFSDDMLITLQKNCPTHAIKTDQNHYLFFSNWDLIDELRRRKIKHIDAIVYEAISDDEIFNWALCTEIGKGAYLQDSNRERYLYLYRLLEDKNAIKRVFNSPRPRTASIALQKITSLTRGKLRKRIEQSVDAPTGLEAFLSGGQIDE